MIVRLLTELHLEFLSLKGGCRGSYESTHVKMPNCWKSHALAQIFLLFINVGFKHDFSCINVCQVLGETLKTKAKREVFNLF